MTRRLTRLTVAALSAAAVLPAGAAAEAPDADGRSCRSTADLAQTFAATGPNATLTVTGAAAGETIRFRHRRSDRLVRIRRGAEPNVLTFAVRTADGETAQYEVVRADDRDDGRLRLRLRVRLLEGQEVVDTARVTVHARAIPAACPARGGDHAREDRREERGRGEDRREGGDDHPGRHRGRDRDED